MCARLVEVSGAHARLVAVRPRNPRRLLARYSAMHLTRPFIASSETADDRSSVLHYHHHITRLTAPFPGQPE